MQQKMRICLAVLLLAFVAGCAATGGRGSQQRELECPTDPDLALYCGGWTVYETIDPYPPEHIMKFDEFVIGKKSNGTHPLAMFPRPEALLDRWNRQRLIPLREIEVESEGEKVHDCMVGRVQVRASTGGHAHEWLAITLRTEIVNTPEIGDEDALDICV